MSGDAVFYLSLIWCVLFVIAVVYTMGYEKGRDSIAPGREGGCHCRCHG